MLWAHSHGGNVLALVTNLLAADRDTRKAFFDAARVFYRPWLVKESRHAGLGPCRTIARNRSPCPTVAARYRDLRHADSLRLGQRGLQPIVALCESPPVATTARSSHASSAAAACTCSRRRTATTFIRLGIAGTNVIPVPLAVRTFLADRRLHEVLQSDVSWRDLLLNFARGQRSPRRRPDPCLVDYHDAGLEVLAPPVGPRGLHAAVLAAVSRRGSLAAILLSRAGCVSTLHRRSPTAGDLRPPLTL